jgi:hypothetical protein
VVVCQRRGGIVTNGECLVLIEVKVVVLARYCVVFPSLVRQMSCQRLTIHSVFHSTNGQRLPANGQQHTNTPLAHLRTLPNHFPVVILFNRPATPRLSILVKNRRRLRPFVLFRANRTAPSYGFRIDAIGGLGRRRRVGGDVAVLVLDCGTFLG